MAKTASSGRGWPDGWLARGCFVFIGAGTVFNVVRAFAEGRTESVVIGLLLVAAWIGLITLGLLSRRHRRDHRPASE